MSQIAPTITVSTEDDYQAYMTRLSRFADRVHIDLADGVFAPSQLIAPDKVWWPSTMQADVHMMYQKPYEYYDILVAMKPDLLVLHAEAELEMVPFIQALQQEGIRVGLALLAHTPVSAIAPLVPMLDHVLVFSGNLGYQGGSAVDFKLLRKVKQIRQLKPEIEIGWDGGANNKNAAKLFEGGIDVLNVGGFIAHAINPEAAYVTLQAIAEAHTSTKGED